MRKPQNHFPALYELCNAVGVVGLGDFYDFNLAIVTGGWHTDFLHVFDFEAFIFF